MDTQVKVKQVDAVYNAVIQVTKDKERAEGQSLSAMLTREAKKQVRSILIAEFTAGNIKLSKVKSESEIAKYVSNLINDRLRKDPRFK